MRLTLLLIAATALAACGDAGRSAPATTNAIAIKDFVYSPMRASVKAGTPITIRNADRAPHTLTDRAGGRAFDSGTIRGGATGTVTFAAAGTYAYFCEFHPYMKGTVSVTG